MFVHSGAFSYEAGKAERRRRTAPPGAIEIRIRRRPFAGEERAR